MRKNKGFTLVELIATLGILSIVLAAVFNVLDSGNMMFLDGIKKENTQSSARLSASTISQAIKTSRICFLADVNSGSFTNSQLQAAALPAGSKALAYIEGINNKRFMFVIETNASGLKELHKINFSDAGYAKYKIDPALQQYSMIDEDYNNNNIVAAHLDDADLSRVDTSEISGFGNNYNLSNARLVYEDFGAAYYLLINKIGDSTSIYKYKLIPTFNTNFTVVSDEKICDYIDSIIISPDFTLVNTAQPVTELHIYKLNIDVNTIDKGKKKRLTTSTFILNYRGDL